MTNYILDIIDPTLHSTTFPATYIAPGSCQALGVVSTSGTPVAATALNATGSAYVAGDTNTYTLRAANIKNSADGMISGKVAATTASINYALIPVGFSPSKVEVIYNDAVKYEWTISDPDILILTYSGPTITTAANGTGYITIVADAAGGDGSVNYVQIGTTILTSTGAWTFRITP